MTEKTQQEKGFFSIVHAEAKSEEPEETEETVQEDPEDPKIALDEACGNTTACAPLKHHLEECNSRVEAGETDEACTEELLHFLHCVNNCVAPKLFEQLK